MEKQGIFCRIFAYSGYFDKCKGLCFTKYFSCALSFFLPLPANSAPSHPPLRHTHSHSKTSLPKEFKTTCAFDLSLTWLLLSYLLQFF